MLDQHFGTLLVFQCLRLHFLEPLLSTQLKVTSCSMSSAPCLLISPGSDLKSRQPVLPQLQTAWIWVKPREQSVKPQRDE